MIRTLISRQGSLSYRSRLTFVFLLVLIVLIADYLLFRNIKNGDSKPKSLTDLIHDEMQQPSGDPTLLLRKDIFGNIPENGSSALEQVEVFYNKTLYAPGVILMVKGDLGNQLFQYACSYALARRLRWPLYIYYTPTPFQNEMIGLSSLNPKKKSFLLDHLRIPLDNFVDKSTQIAGAVLNFDKEGVLDNTFRMGKRMPKLFLQLNGASSYHKSIPYWRRFTDDFRVIFKPREWAVSGKNLRKLQAKIKRFRESVAVHVSTDSAGNFPKLFYEQAIRKMATILQSRGSAKPVFFLFFSSIKLSEEFEEVGNKLGDYEMFYQTTSKKPTVVEEFYLMMMCNHVIFLRSPLAWWVAYLKEYKGKIGMAPSFNPKYFGKPVGNGSSAFQVKLNGKVYGSREWMEVGSLGGEEDMIM